MIIVAMVAVSVVGIVPEVLVVFKSVGVHVPVMNVCAAVSTIVAVVVVVALHQEA